MIAEKNIAYSFQPTHSRLPRIASNCRSALLILAAIVLCCGLLRAQPDSGLSEARSLLARNDNSAAEAAIRGYLRVHPDSADAHFLLAYTLFREKKAADSLHEYTDAARYRKPGADDLMTIGADYVLLNDNEDADLLFLKVTKLQPENELAWYYLGRARFYENRYEDAIKVFTLCLQLKPKDVPAETNLGLAYFELDRTQDAASAYRQAIDWDTQSGDSDGQPYLDMGLLLRKEQRIQESLTYLQHAAQLEPNNPEAHFELAKTQEDLHRHADAESQLRAVLKLAPEASPVHYLLGRVLKAEGRLDESSAEFAVTSKLNGAHSSKDLTNFNFGQTPSEHPAAAPASSTAK